MRWHVDYLTGINMPSIRHIFVWPPNFMSIYMFIISFSKYHKWSCSNNYVSRTNWKMLGSNHQIYDIQYFFLWRILISVYSLCLCLSLSPSSFVLIGCQYLLCMGVWVCFTTFFMGFPCNLNPFLSILLSKLFAIKTQEK